MNRLYRFIFTILLVGALFGANAESFKAAPSHDEADLGADLGYRMDQTLLVDAD